MSEEKRDEIYPVSGMYKDWFLDYASYVILERAVPTVEDGLKPVQRRILHSMFTMDDGRYHKVANIIGNTMQYHPHGDAAIGDALVNLGQKELLIDTQGNWGDARTGDPAAAPRYIEARLSKFALDILFNPKTTEWQLTYDGRKKEPITLPVKFPLLLALGVEGIAVGLATKILPHNFNELIDAAIKHLQNKDFELYPDFLTGGLMDVADYNDGLRGGKIKVRAKIEKLDKKTLIIKEIPYNTTTNSLIDSILKANDKGTIKIKKVVDNTAKDLEIRIDLPPNTSPDKTIDALYAFTLCESSISPNACVIIDNKPVFWGVKQILKTTTNQTLQLLKTELEIKLNELQEKWHFSSLEKIFIEERIYRDIEECETWDEIITAIDNGLEPFKKLLFREVTREDIEKLTEIRIKRISKFDSFKADEQIKSLEDEISHTKNNLANIIDFTINYFKNLKNKYGKGKERKTSITTFGDIDRSEVIVANEKLYANFSEGFVGTSLKKDQFIADCSDIDDIIVFRKDGVYLVSKVSSKAFFGKDIIHVAVWKKGDDRTTYNLIYRDSSAGATFIKRFQVTSITRDKEYNATQGKKGSEILYFSCNPNGEAEIIEVYLHGLSKARKKHFDYDFSDLAIKGRSSKGNILSKYRVRKIQFKEQGISTIGGRDIWFDKSIGRINTDERGQLIGNFQTNENIIVIYTSGEYEIFEQDFNLHFKSEVILYIGKFYPKKIITAIHYQNNHNAYFLKRFQIETSTLNKRFLFIGDHKKDQLIFLSLDKAPRIKLKAKKENGTEYDEEIVLSETIDVKGWKSIGNKITYDEFMSLEVLEPLEIEEEDNTDDEQILEEDKTTKGQQKDLFEDN